ncbi:transglutaminase family protein [Sphingobium sp. SCG-1]|uniref:transglutaminase family protein n=1 Tax=Sphingobium sp. SCG-1 TaxID=2072936 RepID=UPI000CD6789D|nr:transglutaminase family protein [Sphingobium sp. SCG-1]AUW58480.1 transglutaminase family protein [Sphingobium sp. SCG-1]
MKLLVRHQTVYKYEAGSSRVAMMLKLRPRDHIGQRVIEWDVSVNGEPVTNFARNAYGDHEALWIRHDRTESATILATGLVETTDTLGVVSGLNELFDPRLFLRETPLTRPSSAIRGMAQNVGGADVLSRLHALSAAVIGHVTYRTGATQASTTAAESFAIGAGVCQDHAQIFISAARSIGVPARYVTGYLLAQGEDALHETHAWTEALVPGLGWIGFDPSNQICVTENYVRVACGLDADDAAPVRGSVTAAGSIWIDADVRIAQASDDEREQQLQKQQQQQFQSVSVSQSVNAGAGGR